MRRAKTKRLRAANGLTSSPSKKKGKYSFIAIKEKSCCHDRRCAGDSLLDELVFERGTFDDYKGLAHFHYRGGRPSPAKAVFKMTRAAPTVVGRYLQRGDQTQVIGVLVRSLPRLYCQMRDVATHGRYQGLTRRDAAEMLNREVRTISRVVIDPQWRGLGLAVHLVRFALEHPDDNPPSTPAQVKFCTNLKFNDGRPMPPASLAGGRPLFSEALAAMGHVSPFFERAGMTRYDRPPRPEQARMLDALRHLNIEPHALASPPLVKQQLTTRDDHEFLLHELRAWRRATSRDDNDRGADLNALLLAARDALLVQPVYYLFQHDTAACANAVIRASGEASVDRASHIHTINPETFS